MALGLLIKVTQWNKQNLQYIRYEILQAGNQSLQGDKEKSAALQMLHFHIQRKKEPHPAQVYSYSDLCFFLKSLDS